MIDFWAILLFVVVVALAAMLTVYSHRQAREIRSLRELVGRAVVMQERARRESKAAEIQFDTPGALAWLGNTLLGEPVLEVRQVYSDLRAVEVSTASGRALVTATPPDVVRRTFKAQEKKAKASGKAGRLAEFSRSPYAGRVKVLDAGQGEGLEYFDLEAAAVGRALGVDWGAPSRLWAMVAK